MLTRTDQEIAAKFRQRLEAVLPSFQMRVFGSRARGDSSPDSDLDIFIALDTVTPQMRMTISEVAWEIGLESGTMISTFVATYDQLKHGALGASPLIHAIEEQGIAV